MAEMRVVVLSAPTQVKAAGLLRYYCEDIAHSYQNEEHQKISWSVVFNEGPVLVVDFCKLAKPTKPIEVLTRYLSTAQLEAMIAPEVNIIS